MRSVKNRRCESLLDYIRGILKYTCPRSLREKTQHFSPQTVIFGGEKSSVLCSISPWHLLSRNAVSLSHS